jgi:hypothetical protein
MQGMHREDILMQFMKQDEKILSIKGIVKKVGESHDFLMIEVTENAHRLDKVELKQKHHTRQIDELFAIKLNIDIFETKMDQQDAWIDAVEKRCKYQEYES